MYVCNILIVIFVKLVSAYLDFDSWGKPGSGILSGNLKWFGAFGQCIEIPDAKYCLVNVLGKFHTSMVS